MDERPGANKAELKTSARVAAESEEGAETGGLGCTSMVEKEVEFSVKWSLPAAFADTAGNEANVDLSESLSAPATERFAEIEPLASGDRTQMMDSMQQMMQAQQLDMMQQIQQLNVKQAQQQTEVHLKLNMLMMLAAGSVLVLVVVNARSMTTEATGAHERESAPQSFETLPLMSRGNRPDC